MEGFIFLYTRLHLFKCYLPIRSVKGRYVINLQLLCIYVCVCDSTNTQLLTWMTNLNYYLLARVHFENISLYCGHFADLIPVTFILGFYVSLVVTRWWGQFETIPWPGKFSRKYLLPQNMLKPNLFVFKICLFMAW